MRYKCAAIAGWVSMQLACCLVAAAQAGDNVHTITVTRTSPWGYKRFQIQSEDKTAVLDTVAGGTDEFVPNSGRIVVAKRHNPHVWVPTTNSEKLFKARCERVKKNTSSYIICVGEFKVPPGTGITYRPTYRSELNGPGTHVVVIHRYNNASDTTPDPNGVIFNSLVALAGNALAALYRATGDRVVVVRCGLGGDIGQISALPAYLAGLNPPVGHGEVITFNSLGHGKRLAVGNRFIRVLRSARAGLNEEDYVGNETELREQFDRTPEPGKSIMDIADFVGIIRPFLREDGFINLLHCFTGESYESNRPPHPVRPCLADRVRQLLPRAGAAVGVSGMVDFPSSGTPYPTESRIDPVTNAPGGWVFSGDH